MQPTRAIAVDWSGAETGAGKKIWLCEVAGGRVVRLESGRDRNEIERELIVEAGLDPRLVVGLDFAFSLPAAFSSQRGHRTVDEVWREVERDGESWLAKCPSPFWGKPGKKKPRLEERVFFRRTELETAAATGARPFSVFQIGGAGAVGVGSVRGMPMLDRLRREGFAVWPFDRAVAPLVIEIWPRIFIGGLNKSDAKEREKFLDDRFPDLAAEHRASAVDSDDGLDSLVCAVAIYRQLAQIAELQRAADPETALEGRIWRPATGSQG